MISSGDAVTHFLSHLKQPLFLDTETTGVDPLTCKLVAIQMYQEGYPVHIIDCRTFELNYLEHILRPLFESEILFVGANIKFDYGFLRRHLNLQMKNVFDVMIAEQVIEGVGFSGARAIKLDLSLEGICKKRGIPVSKAEREWFIGLDTRVEEWNAPFPDEQVKYMEQDVLVLEHVFYSQIEEINRKRVGGTCQLEFDALPAFGEMEYNGIKVNVPGWREFIADQAVQAGELGNQVVEAFGPPILAFQMAEYDKKKEEYDRWIIDRDSRVVYLREFCYPNIPSPKMGWGEWKTKLMKEWREAHPNPGNPKPPPELPNINSHDQLMIAFQALKIPAKNTSEEMLKELKDQYPSIALLLRYRKKNKFVESFGETLLEKINEQTGRIHPDVNPIGADTGRSSFTRPNTQQWPSRGEDGRRLRSLVIPNQGNVFVINDYPNIELRIFAYMSNCQRMLRAFEAGEDLHSITPRAMFGLSDDVDVKHTVACDRNGRILNGWTYREIGKVVNFGIIYGMGIHKLARTLNTTLVEAEALMAGYYAMYPEVEVYQKKVKAQALRDKVTRTLGGRVHYYLVPQKPELDRSLPFKEANQMLWDAKKDYRKKISSIERMACNYPIQGSSADITKACLGRLVKRLDLNRVKIVLVVHDEVILECKAEDGAETARILEEAMTESCAVFMPKMIVNCKGATVAEAWVKE